MDTSPNKKPAFLLIFYPEFSSPLGPSEKVILGKLEVAQLTIQFLGHFILTILLGQSILEIVRTHFAAEGGAGQKSEKSI